MSSDVSLYVLFAAAAAWIVYWVVRSGGLSGFMYGSPIRSELAEIEGEGRGPYDMAVAVHVLEPKETGQGPHVGLMVESSSFASLRKTPIRLRRSEARRLADALTRALEEAESGG